MDDAIDSRLWRRVDGEVEVGASFGEHVSQQCIQFVHRSNSLFRGGGRRLGVTFRIKHILSGDFGSDLALVEQCLHGIVHGEHAELLAGLHGIF